MNHLLKSVATIGLCVMISAGCKSKLLASRNASTQRPVTEVAESKTESTEDMSIGQASYEQFATNPNASPYGRSPYHFGGAAGTGASSSLGGSASTANSKRC